MTKYNNVKSKYIQERIKKSSFKNDKDYIDNLIFLENYILGKEKLSWASSFILNNFREDYKQILKELKPEEYKKEIREEKKESEKDKKEEERWEKEEMAEEEKDKKEWAKAGGKI